MAEDDQKKPKIEPLFMVAAPDTSKPKEDPPWMVSFIDTLSLLLTFFVLLFSMSTLEKSVWEEVVNTFDSVFEDVDNAGVTAKPLDEAVPEILRKRAINLDYLGRILATQLAHNGLGDAVRIQYLEDRVVISLPSDLLFNPSSATLSPDATTPLMIVSGILRNVKNKIEIYGHTDPNPLRGGDFTSNWELSLARAQAMAHRLNDLGLRRRVSVLGFADTKFPDLVNSLTESEKYSLSRRVDIVIYPYVS